MRAPLSLACLASGGGRTILNLLNEIEAGRLPARIDVVLTSRPGTPAASRCRDRGLAVEEPPCDEEVNSWMLNRLEAHTPELVCLCGFLRLLPIPPWLIDRVINIHPALLPNFGGQGMYGMAVHEAVLRSGRTESGCTVHLVDDVYDHGVTILQRRCPVLPGDTADSLAARVFEQECRAFPEAIRLIWERRVRRANGPVEVAEPGSFWPDAIVRPARS